MWQAGQPVAFHHGAGNSSQVRNYNYSEQQQQPSQVKSNQFSLYQGLVLSKNENNMENCEGVWNNHGGAEERATGRGEKDNQPGGGCAPHPEGGRLTRIEGLGKDFHRNIRPLIRILALFSSEFWYQIR